MEENKTLAEQRREALFYVKKSGYETLTEAQRKEMNDYCDGYKKFLDDGKTEREAVCAAVALAEAEGFAPYERGREYKSGDKFYFNQGDKFIALVVMGEKSLAEGVNIGAAHIDSPRLDLKPSPLFEQENVAYFKTHYYGGIRKYQWVTIPLELRGVVALTDGTVVKVNIGAEPNDPKLVITDLLPHLADEQAKKPLYQAFPAENLNLLLGTEPFPDSEGSDRVKLNIMCLLNEKYGIREEDFISAELSAVPAVNASDIGLDRSLLGAYGQDDRVCGYASLIGMLKAEKFEKTGVCLLVDKEEIGSTGVSGMKSQAFDFLMSELCAKQGVTLGECYANSLCLSADVTAAFDPMYAEVYEKRNSAILNCGMGFSKYTGARGKSGCNDASAEVVAQIRRIMDDSGVLWQMAELGKVDAGGGGTVAAYMGERNIPTMDAGVPVLCMHAPFEVTSKLDCYMTFRGMKALFES